MNKPDSYESYTFWKNNPHTMSIVYHYFDIWNLKMIVASIPLKMYILCQQFQLKMDEKWWQLWYNPLFEILISIKREIH